MLALALAGVGILAFLRAGKTDDSLLRDARHTSQQTARAVGSQLTAVDVQETMGEPRAETIAALVADRVGSVGSVTIWSRDGVVIFAQDTNLIGTEDRGLRAQVARVFAHGTQTEASEDAIQTFVPVSIGDENGPVVVAEVVLPSEEIVSGGRTLTYGSVVAGLLAVLALTGAFRTSGGSSERSSEQDWGAGRRSKKTMRLTDGLLNHAAPEETELGEPGRVTREIGEPDDALATGKGPLVEAEAKIRMTEERGTRAEADLRGGTDVRGEADQLVKAELEVIRSELERIKEQSEQMRRQLGSGQGARVEVERIRRVAADADARADRVEAEIEELRMRLQDVETRATQQAWGTQKAEMAVLEVEARTEAAEARVEASLAETSSSAQGSAEIHRQTSKTGGLETERGAPAADRDGLTHERDALAAERDRSRDLSDVTRGEVDGARADLDTIRRELAELASSYEKTAGRAVPLGTRVPDLNDAVRETHDRPGLADELDRIRGEAERADGELAKALEEIDSLQRQLEAALSQLGVSRDDLDAARSELEVAKGELARARDEHEVTRAELEGVRGEEGSAREHLDLVRRELETARQDLATARTELQVSCEARDRMGAELQTTQGALEAIQIHHDTARTELDEVRGELSATKAAVGSARLELDSARSNERTARIEAGEARSALDTVSAELSTAHDETEAAWNEARALTERMDEHVQRAAHAEATVLELSQRVHELGMRPDLTPAVEELRSALEAAKADLKERDAQLAEARNELVAARTSVQRTVAQADELKNEAARLHSDKEALESRLSEAKRLLEREEGRMAEATAHAREAAARAEKLAARGEAAEAAAEAAEARARAAEARARAAEDRVNEVSSRAAQAEAMAVELTDRTNRAEGLVTELAARAERAEARADVLAPLADRTQELEAAATADTQGLVRELSAMTAELERRNAEPQPEVAAADVRSDGWHEGGRRLTHTQRGLTRFQGMVEGAAEDRPLEPEPMIPASAATAAVDALSLDAKRSLSAIFGLARTLSGGRTSQQDGRLLQQLITQARRMEHAIGDILDADQLTRGEPVLQPRSTEIDTLLRRVVREFPLAGDRHLDVSAETATIQVDPMRVERLIDDLLTSAVSRTNDGDRIVLRLEHATDGILISVEDGRPATGDQTAGAAATFLAKLHGGWARAESLPDGTGVVRAFIPSTWSGSQSGDPQAEAATLE